MELFKVKWSEKMIIETAQYKLKTGTNEKEFIQSSEEIQREFLEKCKGFISRQLLKSDDGYWMDYLHWRNEDDAKQAAEKFTQHPSTKKFESMIDPNTAKMMHFKIIQEF